MLNQILSQLRRRAPLTDIALDTSADLGRTTGVTSVTVTYTCGGLNPTLLVQVVSEAADNTTGVTYNGIPLKLLFRKAFGGASFQTVWVLIGPPVGTFNIVVSGASDSYDIQAISYKNTSQTQIDSIAMGSAPAATSVTTIIQTVADRCWVVHFIEDSVSGSGFTYTNLTQRQGTAQGVIADSNGPITPAGLFSGTVTNISQSWGSVAVSLAPFVG